MRKLPAILTQVNELSTFTSEDSKYWIDVNLGLKKGFELPVTQQNILDDINGSFTEQFRNQNVDIRKLDVAHFSELLSQVDLTPLGRFITPLGIDHHYHVNAGLGDRKFHLFVDLKCIPTTMDNYGSPVASICFISAKIVIGGETITAILFKYIGPDDLLGIHKLVLNCGVQATNRELGGWLRYVRALTHTEHLTLLDFQSQLH